MFVRSQISPKEGSTVSLSLALPGSPRMLDAKGTVAPRSEASPKDNGFWVRFEVLSPAARAFSDEFRQRLDACIEALSG